MPSRPAIVKVVKRLHRFALVLAAALTLMSLWIQGTQLMVGLLASLLIYGAVWQQLTMLGRLQRYVVALILCLLAAVESIVATCVLYVAGMARLPPGGFGSLLYINVIWVTGTAVLCGFILVMEELNRKFDKWLDKRHRRPPPLT